MNNNFLKKTFNFLSTDYILEKYKNEDFITILRLKFLYKLLLSFTIVTLLVIILNSLLLSENFIKEGLYNLIVVIEYALLLIYIFLIWLVRIGHHRIVSHFLLITIFSSIWGIMYFDNTGLLTKIDTVVYILVIISTTPLLVSNKRFCITIYTLVNLILLFLFTFSLIKTEHLHTIDLYDFLIDSSIAMIFTGIVAYSNIKINKTALNRATQDINARNEAELSLLKSEKKFREMSELLPQTMVETDMTGKYTYINKHGFELLGYDEADFQKGIFILDTIAEVDHKKAKQNFSGILTGDNKTGNIYLGVKKNGSLCPIQVFSSPITENDKILGVRAVIVDISERVAAEKEIKESKDRIQSLSENIPGVIYRSLYDKNYTTLYVNSEIETITGYPASDFIYNEKRSYSSLIYFEDISRTECIVKQAIEANKAWEMEYRIKHKDGSIKWVYEKGRSIKNDEINYEYIDGFILDITKKKEAEIILQKNKDFISRTFENSQLPIVIIHGDTQTIIDCNTAAVKQYQHDSKKETLKQNIQNLSAPVQYDGTPSKEKATFYIKEAIEKGSVVFEWLHQNPNGRLWDAEVHLQSFTLNNDKYLQYSLVDITQRKNAEKALKKENLFVEKLLDSLPVLFYLYDRELKLKKWNKKHVDLLGYSDEELLNIPIQTWYRTEEEISFVKNTINYVIEHDSFQNIEANLHRKDNVPVPFLLTGVRLDTDEGPMLMGVGLDITDRKAIEEQLKQSEEQFKAMIELLPYSVMVTDMDGKHLIINDAYSKELGCSKEDAIGKTAQDFGYFVDSNTLEFVGKKLTETGFVENIESAVNKPNGRTEYVLFSCKIININQTPLILSSSINITERKKIENELENYRFNLEHLVKVRTEELAATNEELVATNEEYQTMNEELFEKSEITKSQNSELKNMLGELKETQSQLYQAEKMASLGILTAGVAHEINNPLNYIMGGYYGLENFFTQPDLEKHPHLKTLLHSIKTGVERAAEIVNGLNQFSRSNEAFSEQCNIQEIIDNCLSMVNNKIKNRITISKNYLPQSPILNGNVGKMHQVFLNIITNACQAIEKEGSIAIKIQTSAKTAVITISDTGCGIPKENLNKVTDPFFTTKDPGEGTGLGLSITYTIIREHKGTFAIESEVDRGTSIIIALPIQTP
ncbi:MAG: PAS domain S-box protein [Bacteroidales bacterium]|nr:PAS domain S-box protein [Bacteroidales bacterium]